MADFGFVMISFACHFIIQACENFYAKIESVAEYLNDVEAVARMMKEFAIFSRHGPNFQGRTILARLQRMNKAMDLAGTDDVVNRAGDEIVHQELHLVIEGEEGFLGDPLWDLLDFFPNIPVS